jgi:division protein CdvB (Snf7/Vps24/ESCRT-III family)
VASRVETAVTMRSVTNSMGSVVKGMDKAMESMNLERVSHFYTDRGLVWEVGCGRGCWGGSF